MIPQIKQELIRLNLAEGCDGEHILFEKYPTKGIRATGSEIITFKAMLVKSNTEIKKMIVKFPRIFNNKNAQHTLENEYNNLLFAKNLMKSSVLQNSIPTLIHYGQINGAPTLVTEFVDGMNLSVLLFGKDVFNSFCRYIPIVLGWLESFKQLKSCNKQEHLSDHLTRLLEIHKSTFPDFSIDKDISLDYLVSKIASGSDLGLTPQHNDFHADNLFLSNETRISVIDWEDFSENSIPAFDAMHFIATLADALFVMLANSNRYSAIQQINSDKNWTSFFDKYFDDCIDMCAIPPKMRQFTIILYLLQSVIFAVDQRKEACEFASKYNFLLSTLPLSISDLNDSLELFCLSKVLGHSTSDLAAAKDRAKELVSRIENRIRSFK